jgi:deazaflavin-dependent oxidoreductase (nitroreductase family)
VAEVQNFNAQLIEAFRASGGRLGGPMEGQPLLLLQTTGAKSGERRVHPMLYLDLDGRRYVFASKAGADASPDWYHNLVANPEVTVEVPGEAYAATAVPVGPEERDRIFAEQVRQQPQFGDYAAKTKRVIPVVELRRLNGA